MEKIKNNQSPIKDLVKALKKDKDYYYGWQANIAMAFYDNMRWSKKRCPSHKDLHKISNDAAKYFLDLLIRV